MDLDLDDVMPINDDDWLLTGTGPDGRQWHARLSPQVGHELADTLEQLGDDGVATVTIDERLLIPAEELRPCPLCGKDGQWIVPTVLVSLTVTECDGCGETLSGSNLTPEMSELAGHLIDSVDAAGGNPTLG